MSHKTLARIAIVVVIVFGTITILYPRLFAPKSPMPVEATPTPPVTAH